MTRWFRSRGSTCIGPLLDLVRALRLCGIREGIGRGVGYAQLLAYTGRSAAIRRRSTTGGVEPLDVAHGAEDARPCARLGLEQEPGDRRRVRAVRIGARGAD